MKSILCFGEALIDFHRRPPAQPGEPPAFVPYTGGAPANVSVAVAKLGGQARFIGMLGVDGFADMLLESLIEHGVDTALVRRTDAALTALAFVTLDAQGERSFSFYRPPSADLLFRESDFDPAAFSDAAIFHVCSNSLTEASIAATTLAGMALARRAGALVSVDMNLRRALWPRGVDPAPAIWAALEAADVVKLSVEELAFLADGSGSEDAVRQRLWQGHARWLVITDGAEMIRWYAPGSVGSQPTFRLPSVDSTGAGDAFVGGLLVGLAEAGVTAAKLPALAGDPARLNALLRFAAASGALAVTRTGSFHAMPTHDQVQALLQQAEDAP